MYKFFNTSFSFS